MSLLERIERGRDPESVESPRASTPFPTRGPPRHGGRGDDSDVRARVQAAVIAEIDPRLDLEKPHEVRQAIERIIAAVLERESVTLLRNERQELTDSILADILGLGPLERLLADETITEIMVNGAQRVYVERNGRIEESAARFTDDAHVLRVIQRIIGPIGRRCDESQPMVDARLPDGSRVHAIIPPIALDGPTLTIRKFGRRPLTVEDLIRLGSLSAESISLLSACVVARLNMVVSGGTGSGKTTLLGVLSSFIPERQRIVTIEDAAELQLRQRHVVRLEARPANIEGKGLVPIRELVRNALRMRPDRIVVGEVRSGEALDMLQAMNTGHDGSLTTAHSNGPRDTLARLETMVLMAGMDLPLRAIREQIASAIDVIVHQERMRDGSRRVTSITEVQGMEGDVIVTQEIFSFTSHVTRDGAVVGELRPTGLRPRFCTRLEEAGVGVDGRVFGLGAAGL